MNQNLITGSVENIKKLSTSEKILIIEDIWESIITSQHNYSINETHKKLLNERLEAYNKNPDEGKSWEDVKKTIQSKL